VSLTATNSSTTVGTTATNNARVVFVPAGQTSAQREIQLVTDNMIESSQSLLFGGGSASLGVLAAVGTGATASAATASEVAQRVVSEVRSNDANGASPVATNSTSNNTFSTTAQQNTATSTAVSASLHGQMSLVDARGKAEIYNNGSGKEKRHSTLVTNSDRLILSPTAILRTGLNLGACWPSFPWNSPCLQRSSPTTAIKNCARVRAGGLAFNR
jgi:hypothetical protein